jgi:hypothetical protein
MLGVIFFGKKRLKKGLQRIGIWLYLPSEKKYSKIGG